MDYAVEAFKITAEQKNKLAAGMKSEPRAKSGVKFPAVARLAMARQKEDKRHARLFSQSVRDRLGDMGYSFRNSAGAPPEQLQNIAKLVEERMPPSIKEVFEREPIFAGERTAIYEKRQDGRVTNLAYVGPIENGLITPDSMVSIGSYQDGSFKVGAPSRAEDFTRGLGPNPVRHILRAVADHLREFTHG